MPNLSTVIFATVVRVIDGDSLMVNFPCDIALVCKNIEVRIAHIDTPEMRGHCPAEKQQALLAKELAKDMLPVGSSVSVNTSAKLDKYRRPLVEVPKLSKALLEQGLAKPYEGAKKADWCVK
jgi:micrococcal nuclease